MREHSISDAHTVADTGLALRADSLDNLFIAAAEGMQEIMVGQVVREVPNKILEFSLEADTVEQLLIDWLSELLYLFDADATLAVSYDIKIDGGRSVRLTGEIGTVAYDRGRHGAAHDLKAVTYYKLEVKRAGDIYTGQVIFDL